MPVLTTGIVRDCCYLLIFYSEKFSSRVLRLSFAVNVNLNLSNNKKNSKPAMGDGEREMDVLSYPLIPSFFLIPSLPRTQSSSEERSRVFFA